MTNKKTRKLTGTASFDSGRGNTMKIKFPEVTPNEVQFFENDCLLNTKDEDTERFTLITSEPEMPVISITNYLDETIRGRLKIEYTKNSGGNVVRKWLNYYPAEENDEVETETIDVDSSLIVDFGDDIRGGKATYEYVIGENEWNEDNIQTFVFYIRGENPNREDVLEYIQDEGYDDDYWFLIRLIRHESGTGNANIFRHFNIGTNYTITSVRGLPNLGLPRGFGLGQIDNFGRLTQTERNNLNLSDLEIGETIIDNQGRTIDWQGYIVASDNQVWNWKDNIDSIITMLDNKATELRGHIRRLRNHINNWNIANPSDLVEIPNNSEEGNITFSWVSSNINNFDEYNDVFDEEPTDTIKSFYDAILLKYYNGIGTTNAHHYMYYTIGENQKPNILIERSSSFVFNGIQTTRYYVQYVCEENE